MDNFEFRNAWWLLLLVPAIPLTLYFRHGRAKVEMGLARGKHRHDKRHSIRERELNRETQRSMRRHHR